VENQRELINRVNWDILLVLDAVRFDYFKKYYKGVLEEGKLLKTESLAAWTMGWLTETFKGNYDDVVLVWDEMITDKVRDITKQLKYGKEFDATKHFNKIVDAWTANHDKDFGLIHPKETTREAFKAIKENPNSRIIVKYYQVHYPYVYYTKVIKSDTNIPKYTSLRKVLYHFISDEIIWTVKDKLNFRPEGWQAQLWLKYGKKGIILGYVQDLKLVLTYCKQIIDAYPNKKIIITADHGERLGEKGRYSHGGKRDRLIKEIPWFEVKNGR